MSDAREDFAKKGDNDGVGAKSILKLLQELGFRHPGWSALVSLEHSLIVEYRIYVNGVYQSSWEFDAAQLPEIPGLSASQDLIAVGASGKPFCPFRGSCDDARSDNCSNMNSTQRLGSESTALSYAKEKFPTPVCAAPGAKVLGADPILTMEISNLPEIVRVYTTLCR